MWFIDDLLDEDEEPEQLNINTDGLYVGKKVFFRDAWYKIVDMVPGTVWVVKEN